MTAAPLSDGVVPPNYKEALYWKISEPIWRAVLINVAALPLTAVFAAISWGLTGVFGRPEDIDQSISGTFIALLFASVFVVIPLHELAHGIAMRAYGARPRYGILWKALAAYATAPGYAFRRDQFLVVLLAPLVCLNLLFYLGIGLLAGTPAVFILAICAVVNGGSAIGDLWICAIILRYPRSAYVVDERDGVRIFWLDNDAKNA